MQQKSENETKFKFWVKVSNGHFDEIIMVPLKSTVKLTSEICEEIL